MLCHSTLGFWKLTNRQTLRALQFDNEYVFEEDIAIVFSNLLALVVFGFFASCIALTGLLALLLTEYLIDG